MPVQRLLKMQLGPGLLLSGMPRPREPASAVPMHPPACSLVPLELTWGGAALLNISLLASDLWAALARYFFFGGCRHGGMAVVSPLRV